MADAAFVVEAGAEVVVFAAAAVAAVVAVFVVAVVVAFVARLAVHVEPPAAELPVVVVLVAGVAGPFAADGLAVVVPLAADVADPSVADVLVEQLAAVDAVGQLVVGAVGRSAAARAVLQQADFVAAAAEAFAGVVAFVDRAVDVADRLAADVVALPAGPLVAFAGRLAVVAAVAFAGQPAVAAVFAALRRAYSVAAEVVGVAAFVAHVVAFADHFVVAQAALQQVDFAAAVA